MRGDDVQNTTGNGVWAERPNSAARMLGVVLELSFERSVRAHQTRDRERTPGRRNKGTHKGSQRVGAGSVLLRTRKCLEHKEHKEHARGRLGVETGNKNTGWGSAIGGGSRCFDLQMQLMFKPPWPGHQVTKYKGSTSLLPSLFRVSPRRLCQNTMLVLFSGILRIYDDWVCQ